MLFADLKGSMELLADRDPEEARKLLDPVLERMMEAVHHYEGTVNQFLGDGFMALFGAPIAHEDDARRAVLAALGIQRHLRDRRTASADVLGDVTLLMGLNTGFVVVGTIGDNLRMDYTAVGTRYYLTNREQAKRELAAKGFVRTLVDVYVKNADWKREPNGRIDVDSLKKLATFMLDKLSWLEKPVNVDELVDQIYLPR